MGKRKRQGPRSGRNQYASNLRGKLTFEITPELGPKGVGGKHPRKVLAEKRAAKRKLKAEKELERLIKSKP